MLSATTKGPETFITVPGDRKQMLPTGFRACRHLKTGSSSGKDSWELLKLCLSLTLCGTSYDYLLIRVPEGLGSIGLGHKVTFVVLVERVLPQMRRRTSETI